MKSGNKIWSTVVDYFLILSAVVGVGFASGKEICVFFFNFGAASILGLITFGLLYIYLFLIIQHITIKLKIKSYNEFNQKIFGSICKFTKIVLAVNFAITSAGMLAGANYLFEKFFNIRYSIPSIVLSVLTFFLLLGGIDKIKIMANLIIPIMIAIIIINSISNITPQNVHFEIVTSNGIMAVYYSLLFAVNNFVTALPILFETKLKSKGKIIAILTICLIILLNILVFASNSFYTDMPMFELSKNVSVAFYYVYFLSMIFALFSTLTISSFNLQNLIAKNRSIMSALLVVLIGLIISTFGYNFIVNYLYVVSGVISGIYVVILIINITILLVKNKIKNDKNKLIIK